MSDHKTIRSDDYANTVTTLGTGRAKSAANTFYDRPDLTTSELDALYEKEPVAARVVDRPVDDATRVPFRIAKANVAFDWASVKSELEDLEVLPTIADAWRWARLYGGAILIPNVDDAVPMDRPLAIERAKRICSLEIIESPFVTPTLNPKLGTAGFRKPRSYQILASTSTKKLGTIDASRAIRFDAFKVPPGRLAQRNNGWAPSVLDRVWDRISRLGNAEGYAGEILHEISMLLLKIRGYKEAMAGSQETKSQLQAVFEEMRRGMDALNTLVLDAEDTLEERTRNVSGVADLLDRFVAALVRCTDMPRTVLLGEQPSGLNASADSEIRAWYDHVAFLRERYLVPPLNRVLSLIFAFRKKRGEPVPTEWTIEWDPLWQPTDQEKAQTGLARAQTASLYHAIGAVAEDEVRTRAAADGDITKLHDDPPPSPEDGT